MFKVTFLSYIGELVNSVPCYIYEALISILCIWVTFTLVIKDPTRNRVMYILKLMLFEYIVLLLCSTIIFRNTMRSRLFNVKPFNSYYRIFDGNDMLIPEVLMNVVVFIPIGFLLVVSFCKKNNRLMLLLVGLGLSLTIELLQYVFKKGFTDIDDVILNVIGCLIGLIIPYAWNLSVRISKIRIL